MTSPSPSPTAQNCSLSRSLGATNTSTPIAQVLLSLVQVSGRKQSFRVFGTGFDRPSARLETAGNVLSDPSRYILQQHPHLHPLEWVPRGHRGRQNRQHSKKAERCINCISTHPTPPHTNVMAYMNEWHGTQPAYAAFHLGQLKNQSFRNLFF